jgi:hypothetical protein
MQRLAAADERHHRLGGEELYQEVDQIARQKQWDGKARIAAGAEGGADEGEAHRGALLHGTHDQTVAHRAPTHLEESFPFSSLF